MLVVIGPYYYVMCLPNLTCICFKHFMLVLFKFVIFWCFAITSFDTSQIACFF